MGYELQAVIAGDGLLQAASQDLAAARVAPLGQGLALMPMTDELFDSVTDGSTHRPLGFWKLPGAFDYVLAEWSTAGPVAYVEADYFGGAGEQRAAVWAEGALELGPLQTDSPISRALRRLGAVAGAATDEFSGVGLDRHRHMEDWIG